MQKRINTMRKVPPKYGRMFKISNISYMQKYETLARFKCQNTRQFHKGMYGKEERRLSLVRPVYRTIFKELTIQWEKKFLDWITSNLERNKNPQDLDKFYNQKCESMPNRETTKFERSQFDSLHYQSLKESANISKYHLRTSEETKLSKGFQFANVFKRVVYLAAITPIEIVMALTIRERIVIKVKRSDTNMILVLADKCNEVLVDKLE